MILLDDLKSAEWKFTAHADGSDKGGRFSINFHEAEIAGVVVKGWRKTWRRGGGEAGYSVEGQAVSTLREVVIIVNKRFTAGDDPEARED